MLCDPKTNVRGEPNINHWADSVEIERVGNIDYALGEQCAPFELWLAHVGQGWCRCSDKFHETGKF